MTDTTPPGDQITGSVGDNADQVAVGKNITQTKNVYMLPRPGGPPLHYPPRAAHFVDRETALAKLLTDLHPGHVVTLCGPGGIGKTALAAEAIAALAPDRFPEGVFFHSFYNQKAAALALEQIARSFGEDPRPTPALAAHFTQFATEQAELGPPGFARLDVVLPHIMAVLDSCVRHAV